MPTLIYTNKGSIKESKKIPSLKLVKSYRANRWTIKEIVCMDCGFEFKIDKKDIRKSRRIVDHTIKSVDVYVPNVCPICYNVKSKDSLDEF